MQPTKATMRRLSPVAALLLAACSSSGRNPPDAAPIPTQTVRVSGQPGLGQGVSSSVRLSAANDIAADTIGAPLDSVWRALPEVYRALVIPTNLLDTDLRQLGTSGTRVYRRLGQSPLRRLLDCGSTQIGPNADSYDILLAATTTLRRLDAATTIVTTSVQATGRPMQHGGSDVVCRTRGELERQVALLLKTRVLPP